MYGRAVVNAMEGNVCERLRPSVWGVLRRVNTLIGEGTMKSIWTVGTLVAVVFCGFVSVEAADKTNGYMPGVYLGGSLSQNELKDLDDDVPSSFSVDESDTGYRVFGGYDFSKYFGIEGGFSDFGEFAISSVPVSAKVSVDGFDLSLVSKLPMSSAVSLMGRLGVLFWDAEVSVSAIGFPIARESDDGNDVLFGLGGEFNFLPLRMRAEFTRYKFDDEDINSFSIALIYRM